MNLTTGRRGSVPTSKQLSTSGLWALQVLRDRHRIRMFGIRRSTLWSTRVRALGIHFLADERDGLWGAALGRGAGYW